ncbi:C40 family peptidase [Spirosoma utsteinense]|uniref:Cell wall-associated NlpC family hydrolase n=1 Tax=Spirosoma utsteinense TaxID=2585773 RepID=A0ABR6WC14_9BACT|nr:C40 family peptidase [Spirosoma utsteinense]MBC3784059.1 cell wall-associated NlpC family hydrolase [Spirosoma utsteinense]MBC3793451.1 cell wall-associated NlpC family hydrolase [Spirosoma utsteinense]
MTKKMLLTALCAVSFGIVQAQTKPTVTDVNPTVTSPQESFYDQIPLVSNVIDYARKHLSIRYRSGGTTTHGFDCSGFTRFCFNKFGISLPHSSAAQGHVGEAVDKDDAQPGDLILFKGHSSGSSRIGHVGLITEVVGNRIKFIHSAWSGGVRYDYLHADYYQRRFMGVRRVVSLLAEK